jgi:type II secretory pathway predicted ATPase ExeA
MHTAGSNTPAFPTFACTARYVPLGAIDEAITRVSRAIDARDAAALVIGPPGTGKTLLCRLIEQRYRSSHQVVVLGETPLEDRETMLRHLLHRLGVDRKTIQDNDPYLALNDYLTRTDKVRDGLIVIVDEAQKLSADVIEAIRMVTNITRDGEPCVFALLCGGAKLDDTLVDTNLESFIQRAATRCYLHPMNAHETRNYIQQTIRNCGAEPATTITDEAIGAIHHACSGIPRLINQLITQAIDCAGESDETLITERIVDRAWAELQQLPSPMVEEKQIAGTSLPVEFGELDGDEATENADIELASSSARWIEDEACAVVGSSSARGEIQHRDQTPRGNRVLFGDFDHEEQLSVGGGFATRPVAKTESPVNLETKLRHEAGIASQTIEIDDHDPQFIRFRGPHRRPVTPADDSDLLVIEDEVTVLPVEAAQSSDDPGQAVSVDFQSMLTKMRGSN